MAKKKKKRAKQKKDSAPELTFADIEAALKRGAKSAAELDKTLKRVFTLTPEQWNMRLD